MLFILNLKTFKLIFKLFIFQNLQKLWPHSLKKSAQKVNSPELEQKSNHEDISVKESPVIEKPLVNHSNENLIDSTKTPMCLINELARFNKVNYFLRFKNLNLTNTYFLDENQCLLIKLIEIIRFLDILRFNLTRLVR